MEGHVKAVGALCIGLSSLCILIGGFVFVVLSGIGFLAQDHDATMVLSTIGLIIAGILVVLSIPGIIGGIGLLNRREWARILVLILSAVQLFNFPIGTAIGVYSIWVLVQPETIRLFNPILPVPSTLS
jgi:hypothetical protein